MNPIFETHKNEIAALCDKYDVIKLDVYGEINTPDYDPSEDFVRFLGIFAKDGDLFLRVTGLMIDLESLLGLRVLVAVDGDLSASFLRSIESTRETLVVATDHRIPA